MKIPEQLIYKDLAKYYDYIYWQKDYKRESIYLERLIKNYKRTNGYYLLDIGCATGNHIKHLSENFECFGLDKNFQLIEIAKSKNIKARFVCSDMKSFAINKKFDVITCLFATISYLTSRDELIKTIINISHHLKKGGIFIVDPWFTKEKFHPGDIYSTHYEDNNIHIDRMTCSKLHGKISLTDENYLIGVKNIGVKHFVDRHKLLLLDKDDFIGILKNSGFKVSSLDKGLLPNRNLFVNVKL